MASRRALWAEDEGTNDCTKCHVAFTYMKFKHHCRKCGLIFCDDCTQSRLLVPQEELVPRPASMMKQKAPEVFGNEDSFREPKRICDACSHELRAKQGELRQKLSMANQERTVDTSETHIGLPQIKYLLENEITNATMMLHKFKHALGEEEVPKELLDISKGVVFLTILKAGFMFTGRYGTGLVVAKLPDGGWSAPSAITISGLGWGFQLGAELTDVMLILSTDSAVDTFKSRAQISVGAELGVSVGPIGRSIGSDVSAGNKGAAHAFSYALSKGLFFGASLEASGIACRKDVNRNFYGEEVSTSSLLSGEYPRPRGAEPLYRALQDIMGDQGTPSGGASSGGLGFSSSVPSFTSNTSTRAISPPSSGGPALATASSDSSRSGDDL